jgi:hypothetical protein
MLINRVHSYENGKRKKMAGELYDPLDAQLSEERLRARLLLKQLNDSREDDHGAQPHPLGTHSKCRQRTLASAAFLLRLRI